MTPANLAVYKLALRTTLTKEFPGFAGLIWVRRKGERTCVTVRGISTVWLWSDDTSGPYRDAKEVAAELRDAIATVNLGPQT